MRTLLLASASLFIWSGVASAQTDSLVTVNIQDVLQDIAIDLNVEETSIPVNVQLPVNVAANVCDVEVSALSAEVDSGSATCAAVTGSQELTQVVQQQVASGGSVEDNNDTASGSGADDNDETASGSEEPTDEETASGGQDATDEDVAADDDATDDVKTGGINSARDLAPGRSDNPAPGQTENPRANAPGQLKACPEGETCE